VQANRKAFDCDNCDCDSEHNAGFEKWYIPEIDLNSAVCLRWLVSARSVMLLRLYNQYKANILPLAGGWLDQPNLFAQAIETIEAHKALSEGKKQNG
jgi:hypothetical protein